MGEGRVPCSRLSSFPLSPTTSQQSSQIGSSPLIGDSVHILPGQPVQRPHVSPETPGGGELQLAEGTRRLPGVLLHVLGEVQAVGVAGPADWTRADAATSWGQMGGEATEVL